MPSYVLSGVDISSNGIKDVNLVLTTPKGVTTASYDYNFFGYVDWSFVANGYSGLSYDGGSFDAGGDFTLLNTSWGAGRQTKVFGIDYFINAFIAPVAGDSLPDFTRDDGAVLLEFATLVALTGSEKAIQKGPFKVGREIDLDKLFADNTSGPVVQGGRSDNRLEGGRKDDLIVGAAGNDVALGKAGRDTLMLGLGNDKGYGGSGGDVISGYDGDDRIWGGKGADQLLGLDGSDVLRGQGGDDKLFGGVGADRLDGGRGNDNLTGDQGADVFVFADGYDADLVRGFGKGADRLALNDNLWTGTLTEEEIVDRFASKSGGKITFDFGEGDTLVLNNYTNLGTLADVIDIV